MAKKKETRMVVVTTDSTRRGVFFGELISEKTESGNPPTFTVELKNARMAVYWSSETKGVLGLASTGPQKGSKITPPVLHIKLNGVTSVMDCTDISVKQWNLGLWS